MPDEIDENQSPFDKIDEIEQKEGRGTKEVIPNIHKWYFSGTGIVPDCVISWFRKIFRKKGD